VKAALRKRLWIALFTAAAIGAAGYAMYRLERTALQPPPADARQAADDPVTTHFQAGVALLNAGQYEQAVAAFHSVLRMAPTLPEAHVNMGFALLGQGDADAALDFFGSAIDLRPMQANAYYGLALALEARGDLDAALGAMRSYIHLTDESDPYLPRARSALWEWEAQRDAARAATPEEGAGSEGARDGD